MRVLVSGGRAFEPDDVVYRKLDRIHAETPIALLVNGWCPTGADKHARDWCLVRKVACLSDPADWDRYDKAAGPIRNQKMLRDWKPDLVVAFPGNRGTANMVRLAKDAGVRVIEYPATTDKEDTR